MSGGEAGAPAPPGPGGHPFYAAAAATPELLDWWEGSFTPTVFAAGRAPARLKLLLRLRLEHAHGVRYPGLGDAAAGVTAEEAAAIGDPVEQLPLPEGERAVLALADELALSNMAGYMSEALCERLQAHYDDATIFELGQTAAILCGFAKFLRVYELTGAPAGGDAAPGPAAPPAA